jgi:CheY-like chemotaxis protein
LKEHPHILLVDDNNMDVVLTLYAFREAGLMVDINVAKNGKEALDYLFGNDKFADRLQYPIPDVILLDLKMPGIDGFEVLRKIKGSGCLKRIPVIILTSSREEKDKNLGYDLGANSYLLKPVSSDGFTEVVKKLCEYWFSLNIGVTD